MTDTVVIQSTVPDLDLPSAIQRVIKAASHRDAIAKGLHEVCKAIDNAKKPVFCILAENCDEPQYKKLVEVLCKENGVPLVRVSDSRQIGEWIGLCKYDAMMNPRKVRKCGSCVLQEFAEEDDAASLVKNTIMKQKEILLDLDEQ
jgi:small subunit ribosomal protein S12e